LENAKIQQVVADQPEDVDVDSLMEKLYLLRKLEVAEKEIAAGQGIPHAEVKHRLSQWL